MESIKKLKVYTRFHRYTRAAMDTKYAACSKSEGDVSPQQFFSAKRSLFRYLGLTLMCFLCFGSYFCYDNPGTLQDKFETNLHIPARDFAILYSVYSWPNVILCFIGGFLLDRVFGIRWGTILYAVLTLCGQLLFAMGTYVNIFWLTILGRFVFGTGSESLIVAQSNYAVIWCEGKALNTVFGLQLGFSQVGSAVSAFIIENIYEFVSEGLSCTSPTCTGIVLFIAAITCFGSMICAFLLGYMDSNAEKILKRNNGKHFELVKLTDIKDFKLDFWLVVLAGAAYRVAIYPFVSLGKLYLMNKYGLKPDAANTVISLFYGVSFIALPLFGVFIDKVGRNIFWVVVSIFGSLFAHGLFAYTYVSPYFCMIMLGTFYSLFTTSLCPMIAFMTSERQLGTAYGIAQALQNLNQAVMSIICGIIIDNYGYFMLELFFLVWLLISLVPAMMIWIINSKSTDKTNDVVKKPVQNSDLVEDVLLQSAIKCAIKKSLSKELMKSDDGS